MNLITLEEFKELDYKSKIDVVNNMLLHTEYNTRTKVTQYFKQYGSLGNSEIQRIASKILYTFDSKLNQYRLNEDVRKDQLENMSTEDRQVHDLNMLALQKELKYLESRLDSHILIHHSDTTPATTRSSNIKKFEGEKESRNYRLNKEVAEAFATYCKAHSTHSVGDILASAMLEFINKNK